MPPGTVAIVLVAAIAHAAWNTVSKYIRGDTVAFVWSYTVASTLLCTPIAIALVVSGTQHVSWQLAAASLISAGLHAVYSLTLQTGYDRADLGVVYPIARGVGPMLTLALAVLLFGERVTGTAAIGALAVIVGIIVVTGNPFGTGARHPVQGVAWGGVTGAAIAAYTLWDSFSITTLHLAPMTYYSGTLLIQSALLTPSAVRRRHRIRSTIHADAAPILTIAALSPLAYLLILTAMRTAPVALVAPLRESSIVIGSLLAWRLFHESHLARRITGAVIVVAGIAAVSL